MIEEENIGKLYEQVIMNVLRGDVISPRGMTTVEQLGVSIRLTNARNNVLVSPVRALNYRFMVAEWIWYMFGREDVAPLVRYNKKMAEFSDDGKTLRGAYGPRILQQAEYILSKLKEDPSTRQAVMTIWERNPKPSKDIPCTVAMQFIQRVGKLNSIVTMRSSDTWLGLPYDLYSFSQILNYFAGCLGLETGFIQINLGSSHLYEIHREQAIDYLGSAYSYFASPQLVPPAPNLLKQCLLNRDCGDEDLIEEPWLRYGKVLVSTGSQEALEHLAS